MNRFENGLFWPTDQHQFNWAKVRSGILTAGCCLFVLGAHSWMVEKDIEEAERIHEQFKIQERAWLACLNGGSVALGDGEIFDCQYAAFRGVK